MNNPRGLAVTPDGRFLYVGHGDPGKDRSTSIGATRIVGVDVQRAKQAIQRALKLLEPTPALGVEAIFVAGKDLRRGGR